MMENGFNTNEFERSLKEQADRFFMTPTERVWKSIYNDLHPGSRWPSLAVGIVMIISLFWIGNTHQSSVINQKPALEKRSDNSGNNTDKTVATPSNNPENPPASDLLQPGVVSMNSRGDDVSSGLSENNSRPNSGNIPTDDTRAEGANKLANSAGHSNDVMNSIALIPLTAGITVTDRLNHKNQFENQNNSGILNAAIPGLKDEAPELLSFNSSHEISNSFNRNSIIFSGKKFPADKMTGPENKEQPGSAGTSAMKKKKKTNKAAWTIFVTPEISNVHFEGNNLNQPGNGIVVNPTSKHDLKKKPHMGFQVGADVNYKLNKKLDIVSGLHINYAGYNVMTSIVHPSLATVTFKDRDGNLFTKNYMTYYANNDNASIKINNYSFQFGIPVGLQLTLFDNQDVRISVASSLEPFFVFRDDAYILTGNGRNFVNDPDLMRRINMNGNFGSFVTFSGHGMNWRVGPSLRYQILSSYHNIYPVKEHLVNYGIMIGVSKAR